MRQIYFYIACFIISEKVVSFWHIWILTVKKKILTTIYIEMKIKIWQNESSHWLFLWEIRIFRFAVNNYIKSINIITRTSEWLTGRFVPVQGSHCNTSYSRSHNPHLIPGCNWRSLLEHFSFSENLHHQIINQAHRIFILS